VGAKTRPMWQFNYQTFIKEFCFFPFFVSLHRVAVHVFVGLFVCPLITRGKKRTIASGIIFGTKIGGS